MKIRKRGVSAMGVGSGIRSQLMQRGRIMRVVLHRARRRMRRRLYMQLEPVRRSRALLWHRFYYAHFRILIWNARHGAIAWTILLLVLVAVSAFWIPALQGSLEHLFAMEERVQELRSLFQTLGGVLLGATAIVSSLVLFSMQVNVERMPHGLFQRLSADRRLLSLKAKISTHLAAGGLPDQNVRDRAALEIRGRAATLYREDHLGSSIEGGMAQADHAKLKPILEELADLISPGTAGQAASQHFF